MGVGLARPFRLKRPAGTALPPDPFARPKTGATRNALYGMGLWTLLWLGYNTDNGYVRRPNFPNNVVELIHGIRAFFPALAIWISLLIIFSRAKRLMPWIISPLGLVLVYAVTGLVSTLAYSVDLTDQSYFAMNYLSIVLVLLAIVLVADPLPDLRQVLRFTWMVGTMITLGLLVGMPFLGGGTYVEPENLSAGPHAYGTYDEVLDMPSTRNTGFARYAAMTALVAFAGILRKGRFRVRVIWGIVLCASLYALILANGRTETLAFVVGVAVILTAERAKRVINIVVGTGAAILLALRGFYSWFFLFITRTGQVDPTLSGRTITWDEGWRVIWDSPLIGYGFQSDRFFVGQHMHNAYLHVLIQSGFVGGGAILIGLFIVWCYIIKYFVINQPQDKSLIPPEIPAVFLFITFSSFTESTFAYFSAAWLLSAPIIAYVTALHRHLHKISVRKTQERVLQTMMARRNFRELKYPLNVNPPASGGGGSPD